MTTALIHLADGGQLRIEAPPGGTLMEAAKQAGVPGVEADCGGSMVCGTCHVIVAAPWLARLPAPSEMEALILEGVPDPHPRARLSCQIQMTEALDGIELTVPQAQR